MRLRIGERGGFRTNLRRVITESNGVFINRGRVRSSTPGRATPTYDRHSGRVVPAGLQFAASFSFGDRPFKTIERLHDQTQPWSIAFLPDGSMLVTERPGRLRIIRNGVLDANPVAGIPAVKTGGEGGLQGLMDVVLHPRFSQNRWVYFTYHKPVGDGEGATTLGRGTWNGAALTDVRDIFESGATETEASRLVFGRDGMIYMTVSAPGAGPHTGRSQDSDDYAGKVVRLREDGSIPADNPFVWRAGYKPGIYTLGHRNGHALAINPETGEVWQTEQGPSGGDKILGAPHLATTFSGWFRRSDRRMAAVNRSNWHDVLHRRSVSPLEAQRVRQRPS